MKKTIIILFVLLLLIGAASAAAPVLSIINNTKTNDTATAKIFLNNSESITFFVDADQTISTWNWSIDHVLQLNNSDNLTTSWSTGKYHYVSLNAEDDGHVIPNDTLRDSDDAETSTSSASYVKLKTITLNQKLYGTVRIKFDLKCYGGPGTAYGKIYHNGVALGTEQSTFSSSYVTKSEDITHDFEKNDTIELWGKLYIMTTTYIQNFRLYYDNDTGTSNTLTWGVNVFPVMATATIGALNETPANEIRNALENKDAPALVMATVLPFTNLIGAFFYAIVWFIVFVMMWIKQKSMNIPMVIGIIFGGLIISFLPEQYQLVATALIVLGIFAVIYVFFKGRG